MRRLLAALVLVGTLSLVVSAGTATHGTVVQGTVTDEDGSSASGAFVLVQPARSSTLEEATNGSEQVVPALLHIADVRPLDIRHNRSDDVGNYTVHLQSRGTYDVVAVTEDGRVSSLKSVTIRFEEATEDLEVDADQVQSVEGSDVAGTPGRTTTVTLSLQNTDDEAVSNLRIGIEALPDGWTVESVTTGGNYDENGRAVEWSRVEPGETVTADVTVAVPEDAEQETHRIELTADADEHFVEHDDAARVLVSPPNSTKTPSATATPLGGDGVRVPLSTSTSAGSPPGGRRVPLLSVAVFTAGVAIAAYAFGRTGLPPDE
jgi:hypothetical protein